MKCIQKCLKFLVAGVTAAALLLAPVSVLLPITAAEAGKTAIDDFIVSTDPADGATAFDVGGKINVVFVDKMAASTIDDDSFYLTKGTSSTEVACSISYSSAKQTATLLTDKDLKKGTVYVAHLSKSIKTVNGDNINSYSWSFTTDNGAVGGDYIDSTNPKDGATDVELDKKVIVKFLEKMESNTIDGASFYMSKTGSTDNLDADVSYTKATKTASLKPTAALESNTSYTVYMDASIMTEDGDSMSAYSWSFTTGSAVASDEYINSTDPEAGDDNVDIDDDISITFEKKMKSSSITKKSFYLRKKGTTKNISCEVEYITKDKTANLNPDGRLLKGTDYVVTLVKTVKTTTGESVAYSWEFTTEE